MKAFSPWRQTLVANALILALGIGAGVLLARELGPEGRGSLAVLYFWPSLIATLGLLALNDSVAWQAGRLGMARDLAISVLVLSVGLGIAIGLSCTAILAYVLPASAQADLKYAQAFAVLFTPAHIANMAMQGLDHGTSRFGRFNVPRLVGPAVYLVALLALFVFDELHVLSALAATGLVPASSLALRVYYHRHDLQVRPSLRLGRQVLARALSFNWANSAQVVVMQMERLMAVSMLPAVAVGHVVVAVTIASTGATLVSNTHQMEELPRAIACETPDQRAKVLWGALSRVARHLVCTFALTIGAAYWGIPVLFGGDYRPAIPLAVVLALSYTLWALRALAVRILRGMSDVRWPAIAEMGTLLVFVLSAGPAIGAAGSTGLVFAHLIANLLGCIVIAIHLLRVHGRPWEHESEREGDCARW